MLSAAQWSFFWGAAPLSPVHRLVIAAPSAVDLLKLLTQGAVFDAKRPAAQYDLWCDFLGARLASVAVRDGIVAGGGDATDERPGVLALGDAGSSGASNAVVPSEPPSRGDTGGTAPLCLECMREVEPEIISEKNTLLVAIRPGATHMVPSQVPPPPSPLPPSPHP